jgi:osmoprotectant transport system ATP-binding protein
MISMREVTKTFPGSGAPAVSSLSLEVASGETVVLVGPSGCGKTTTMKMINRLIEPTSGTILVDGTDVMKQDPVELRRGIGYVIQSIGLMPHRTVAENVGTVPKLVGWEETRTRARVGELAEMLELDPDLLGRYPNELSGGQRQRVGVARALAVDPPVMLMDEPFGAVDPIVRERLQDQFLRIQAELKKTTVFVTHDVDEAIKMADRIAILNRGGIVEQYAAPADILREPANDFVRRFIGQERALKRLRLLKVGDVELEEGPVVTPSTSTADALAVMERLGYSWVCVVEDGEVLGWASREDLAGRDTVGEASPQKFAAYVTRESSVLQALDAVVTSKTEVAVVATEGQTYAGILTIDAIRSELG